MRQTVTFRGFYHWMIEFDPPDDQKAQEGLRRVLGLLSGDGQSPPPPPPEREAYGKQRETYDTKGGTDL